MKSTLGHERYFKIRNKPGFHEVQINICALVYNSSTFKLLNTNQLAFPPKPLNHPPLPPPKKN